MQPSMQKLENIKPGQTCLDTLNAYQMKRECAEAREMKEVVRKIESEMQREGGRNV